MTISDKYFVKQGTDAFQDFTVKFNGLTILKIDNFDKKGKAKNIYTQSWVNSSSEDVFVPDVVYFEQPDLDITFMVTDSYNTSCSCNISDCMIVSTVDLFLFLPNI